LAQTNTDEADIQRLLARLGEAWGRGDADAFGARFRNDGTFTNANGAFFAGRDAFNRRHDDVFRGVFRNTQSVMTIRKLRLVRPDVAVVDVDVKLSGSNLRPPGIQTEADGSLRSCLLMVLVKEEGEWWISAYHNVWRAALA
jgi:uncharacterized protein (TIGR02246 family)